MSIRIKGKSYGPLMVEFQTVASETVASNAQDTITSVSDLKVCVTGEKAQSLPHRIESFNILASYHFDG